MNNSLKYLQDLSVKLNSNRLFELFVVLIIMFSAFAFLNMVIGIVVNVLEEERAREKRVNDEKNGVINLETIHQQLMKIQHQIKNNTTE